MRRLALALLCGLLAGGGAGAFAHKTPPRHHPPRKHHRHRPRPKPPRKPAHHRPARRPAATTPTVPTTTPTDPAVDPATDTNGTDTTGSVTTTPAAPLGHSLGVTASDAPSGAFVLSVSRTVLGAGAELIEFRNTSQDGHDLRIDAGDGTQQAAWDELASLADPVARTVTLSAGTYRVYCTLHAGMEHQLTVQ